jgi:hypothetical protein
VRQALAADSSSYRSGRADAHDVDADALDGLADALPQLIEELGADGVAARLRLVAGSVRAKADQMRLSGPPWRVSS